jgi:hypothetical protein
MTPYRQCRLLYRLRGQAAIEYIVVLAFAVMVILKPFSLSTSATAPMEAPALQQLATAIKDYHKNYTYAMSIAMIPNCDYETSIEKLLSIPDNTATPAQVSSIIKKPMLLDRCIDWQDPKLPFDLDPAAIANTLGIPTTPAAVGSFIGDMVTTYVKDAVKNFLDPGNLLDGMFEMPSSPSEIINLILP